MTEEKTIFVHQCGCQVCQSKTDPDVVVRHQHINLLLSRLTEPQQRWYVATLSEAPDSPGDRQLSLITGLDEKTIRRGKQEIGDALSGVPQERQRKKGGGRWPAEKKTRN
jgi:hypothetical protein